MWLPSTAGAEGRRKEATGDRYGGSVRNKAAGGRNVAASTAKAASRKRSKQQEEKILAESMVVREGDVAADSKAAGLRNG